MGGGSPPNSNRDRSTDRGGDDSQGSGDGDWPGKQLFRCGSPHEILQRLIDGDPLELNARCRERLRTQALLLAPNRLYLRAAARVAHAASSYDGHPVLDIWLAERISVSVKELIEEDREEERRGWPVAEIAESSTLPGAWGVEPNLVRRSCLAFNTQPYEVRRTFYELVVDRKSMSRYVAEGNGPPAKVQKQLKRAMRALGLADDQGQSRPEGGLHDV